MVRRTFPAIPMFGLGLAFATNAALAGTVTVITSFPKELTAAYKKAFEAKYPNDKLEILNKNTAAGIAFVREQPVGSRPEIVWASAPDALEVLASSKLLQKSDAQNPAVPAKSEQRWRTFHNEQTLPEDVRTRRDSPEAVCALPKIRLAGNLSPRTDQRICPPARVHRLGLQQGLAEIHGEDV